MASLANRPLFGGAISLALPSNLIDASDLRQIPDTQEVFLYPDSTKSLILEVLQRVEPNDSRDAAQFHFDSLAHDNSAQSSTVQGITHVPNDRGGDDLTPSHTLLTGRQLVTKFNKSEVDEVQIFMALYRIESKNTDLVLTMNVPLRSADGGAVGEEGLAAAQKDFEAAARSLRILDFGLFV
ncbi:Mog1p/PsbP-like protein [Panus rudis PR-1116 ss-1]|nr:Mog1p/PsbP-like protein [Panus rudis PR-1116 ss-1]